MKAEITKKLQNYQIELDNLIVNVEIFIRSDQFVPSYAISILNISPNTNIILAKLKDDFVNRVTSGALKLEDDESKESIQQSFQRQISQLIDKYFPKIEKRNKELLVN
jgi:hypothetical protein